MKRLRVRKHKKSFHLSLGARGERLAWDYLAASGFEILERNYRTGLGEIDVIARKGGRLSFIEIKTRRSHHFGRPEEAVDRKKQHKIIRIAQHYLKKAGSQSASCSFDVLALTWPEGQPPEFRLIENAFSADEQVE